MKREHTQKNGKKVKLKFSKRKLYASEVLLPDQVKYICDNPTINKVHVIGRTGHFCINEDSYSVAMKVKANHPNENVLVLNFANPVHTGGGVRKGARAQEEDLCRKHIKEQDEIITKAIYSHYRDDEWVMKYIDMRWPKKKSDIIRDGF